MAITATNSHQRLQTRDGLTRQGRRGSVSDRCRRGPRIGRHRASETAQTRVRSTPITGSDWGGWRVFATPTPCLTWCHSDRCFPSGFGAPVTPLSCTQTMAAIRFLGHQPRFMDRILALPQDGLCTITERTQDNMQGTKAHGQESVVMRHSNPSTIHR